MEGDAKATRSVYVPFLREWEFVTIMGDGGLMNRKKVISALTKFITQIPNGKTGADELELPGKVYLNGRIYSHRVFDDGKIINTAMLLTLERVNVSLKEDKIPCNKHTQTTLGTRLVNQLFCATTSSGSKYYIYETGMSGPMLDVLSKCFRKEIVDARYLYQEAEKNVLAETSLRV